MAKPNWGYGMNVIRTIPKYATEEWIKLLFDPNSGPAPEGFEPLSYPFSTKFRRDIGGGFLYIRYKDEIIGYGSIADVQSHDGDMVGEENIPIGTGHKIILEAPLTHVPFVLSYPGSFRWKYIEANLHQKAL
jgi:hypothetical protein